MTLPVVFTANGPTGYNLTNSLRFRASASANLSKTWGSNGNSQIFTISAWVKRSALGSIQDIVTARQNGLNNLSFRFTASDTLEVYAFSGGSLVMNLITTQVFRDPSAWYHVVFAVDTTQATSTNRVKFYVNGTQITAFSTATYPSLNATTLWNQTAATHYFATYDGSSELFDGYMDEINVIDGQALTPTSFGSFNALTGVWQPAKYTGTYGTNGFYLPFTDNSALTTSSNVGLGKDFSGNGNYWTTNNISITAGTTYDSMTDVPTLTSATTANYCVLNPLDKNTSITASNGNLTATTPSGFALIRSTMFLPTGKYYWEVTCTTTGNGFVGISSAGESLSSRGAETANSATISTANGNLRTSGADSAYGSAVSNGNVMMFALDMTSGKFWAGKSGTWFASGDPAAGTNAGKTGLTVAVAPSISLYDSENYSANFGQRPFSYTPPTGFVALNTFNLPNSTIVAGNKQMDAITYTGNGTTQNITTANFQPDWLWVKERSEARSNLVWDSVRGSNLGLITNTTSAESTQPSFTGFLSNGFGVSNSDSSDITNKNAQTYVGWIWKANGTAVTNTAGSISAQVSANTTAGFSVVTYTGNGSAATIGHGLGVAPRMIIVKARNNARGWAVYHGSLANTQALVLNSTSAVQTQPNFWNSTSPTSTVFSVGTDDDTGFNGRTYVAYCFAEVAGYSKFGSYTGNGSADGPFVYLGFRPRYVMIKNTTSAYDWVIFDTARNTYNVMGARLYPNTSSAESTLNSFDIVSNGFKIRFASGFQEINNTGDNYIYMAFAESPFKVSLAR